jgi:hypothetical protein
VIDTDYLGDLSFIFFFFFFFDYEELPLVLVVVMVLVVVDVKVKVKVAVEVVVLAVAVTLAVTLTVFFFKVVVMASRMVFRVVVVESSFLGNLKVVFAWIHSLKVGEPSEIANFEGFTSFCTSPQAREILCKSREMSFLW